MSEISTLAIAPDVVVLKIDRVEKRNALSRAMLNSLMTEFRAAEHSGVRALIFWGNGQCFSAGADFHDLCGDASDMEYDNLMRQLVLAIQQSTMTCIAAIDGPCMGAGLDLALACDVRVASLHAKFALPAVKMGILYNPERAVEIMGLLGNLTERLLLLGETVSIEETVGTRLVTHKEYVKNSAFDMAVALAKASAELPEEAQIITKKFIRESDKHPNTYWMQLREKLLVSEERRQIIQRKKGVM
ncbi:enoyl-CoA hydratase/isomerase family protein [Advenella sp. RU8]|uniref:enoyl-CoA hydratase/isomerase family protein n=1 Tax=Advenella sp. RU8 TaxID=3399575 RepID=UPI003AAA9360